MALKEEADREASILEVAHWFQARHDLFNTCRFYEIGIRLTDNTPEKHNSPFWHYADRLRYVFHVEIERVANVSAWGLEEDATHTILLEQWVELVFSQRDRGRAYLLIDVQTILEYWKGIWSKPDWSGIATELDGFRLTYKLSQKRWEKELRG
mmetsp:Transcript_10347/g.25996  ORF Transcript_10347/g.25996 Transcript_10347/m.25996 type:complete len:153 (-) Transcript_10347:73-531(-)